MFYRRKINNPFIALLKHAQDLSKKIDSYTAIINARSVGDTAPWFRTQSRHDLNKKKHQGALDHLMPTANALIKIITMLKSCYPSIDHTACVAALETIEQHLGAIASRSAYTFGTDSFNSYYHELLSLVEQFKKLTCPTDTLPLLSFEAAQDFLPQERFKQIEIDHYAPLKKQLERVLQRPPTANGKTYHGVNRYLYEALRFTTAAINGYSPAPNDHSFANNNLAAAEQRLGAVASWSPYFRTGCGTFNFEFNRYYQRTCRLVEAAKTSIANTSDDPHVMLGIEATSPTTYAHSSSRRDIVPELSPFEAYELLRLGQLTPENHSSKRLSVVLSAATVSSVTTLNPWIQVRPLSSAAPMDDRAKRVESQRRSAATIFRSVHSLSGIELPTLSPLQNP